MKIKNFLYSKIQIILGVAPLNLFTVLMSKNDLHSGTEHIQLQGPTWSIYIKMNNFNHFNTSKSIKKVPCVF